MLRKAILVVFFAATLNGCVSVGTKIDPTVVASFQPGVTTVAEAEAKLGKPNSVTTDSVGETYVTYVYAHAQSSASSFIPVAGAFVGHTDSDTVSTVLVFDRAGKFVRSSTTQGQTSAGMLNHGT